MTYRPDVDGLRAVAVLAVVLFHYKLAGVTGGFIGVDVFFVISGFLIAGLLRTEIDAGTFSYADFFARRARRLFPALFATVVACMAIGFVLFAPYHLARLAGASVFALTGLSNFYFWSEAGYFDAGAYYKPLLHTWSLAVEAQMYVLLPVAIVLAIRWFRAGVIIALLLMLAVLGLIATELTIDRNAAAAFYLLPFRLAEFIAGVCLVWLPLSATTARRPVQECVAVIGLALIFGSAFALAEDSRFPGLAAMPACLGTAAVIWAGPTTLIGRLLAAPPLRMIGIISYSLYLVHWPLIVFAHYISNEMPSISARVGLIGLSFLLAVLSYHFVERPFRKSPHQGDVAHGFHGTRLSPSAIGFVFSFLALIASLPLATAWASEGWTWRVPAVAPPRLLQHDITPRVTKRHRKIMQDFSVTDVYGVGSTKPDARDGLLIGDSHAQHFVPLADYIGKFHNIRFTVFTLPGCAPVFGTIRVRVNEKLGEDEERWRNDCPKFVAAWEALIRQQKFDVVVLAARWDKYVEPAAYGRYHIEPNFLATREERNPTLETSRRTLETHLQATVDTIRATGADVVLISQVPVSGKPLRGCNMLPRYALSEAFIEARCQSIDRMTAIQRLEFSDRLMRRLAEKPGVSALVPSSHFCPPTQSDCLFVLGKTVLYRDDDHLNGLGSIWLARQWLQEPGMALQLGAKQP